MTMEFFAKMGRGVVRLSSWIAFSVFALLSGFGAASGVCLANEPANVTASHAHVDAAIDQLGSASFRERELATRELLQRGPMAIPQLESALPAAKGEVRHRIRAILDNQRRSSDEITKRAAEKAIARIASSKDKISSAWARSILPLPGEPVALQSPAQKQG